MSYIQITPMPDKVFGATVTGVKLAELTDDSFTTVSYTHLTLPTILLV